MWCLANMICVLMSSLERSLQINTKFFSDQIYPLMKHFYLDVSGLLLHDDASIHRPRGLPEWFEDKNYENHVLWQAPYLNSSEHVLEIVE